MRELGLPYVCGDYLLVHAGVRPGVALSAQAALDLLWIREPFLAGARPLQKLVVHALPPAPRVHSDHRRIGLDIGAHVSGVLGACRLVGAGRSFLQAIAGPVGVEIRRQTA